MARSKTKGSRGAVAAKKVEQYEHTDKQRTNNPPVGLVTPETDPDAGNRRYAYDPHLDPQLGWAGKAEHTSFDVPTVSLHVHERIDPKTILEAVRKRDSGSESPQIPLFDQPKENPPLREALDFYKHAHGWSNRLIAGDSLLVMNSLLEKEGMAGRVQMVYIDPPYGIRYGSNFQPFVNRRDVKDGKDEDLTQEPEMVRAFRDTWELGIHSYLTYLRDRLLLVRELLHEGGSLFVQIGDENVHLVRSLLDEVLGQSNFVSLITFTTTTTTTGRYLANTSSYLLWYARKTEALKYRPLFVEKAIGQAGATKYDQVDPSGRSYTLDNLTSPRIRSARTGYFPVRVDGRQYLPRAGEWKTHREGMNRLLAAGRVLVQGSTLRYARYLDDFAAYPISSVWPDLGGIQSRSDPKVYVVQTSPTLVQRCLLMTTDPGDLVFDPTCGAGTTAFVAEHWGRRWMTCDTSRVALTLAKQRLMTAQYDYYELAHPQEGVGSGFVYKTIPHVTLKAIANNPEIREGMGRAEIDRAIAKYAEQETLYDQPRIDRSRTRVTGPYTVEAVPAPVVQPLSQDLEVHDADASVARTGETLRQAEWREELFRTGIRGKKGQMMRFTRVEPLPGTRWLHAEAETLPAAEGDDLAKDHAGALRVVVSFGPEHQPLEQRQVEQAWHEARQLIPRPSLLVFAAFQFDPEAAKDIDTLSPEKAGIALLKVQMNADLLTGDLKKKRASNQSFWLIGQPDVLLRPIEDGDHVGQWQVEVRGFDYYNTKDGDVISGGVEQIAMWMLDTDYDDRSLYPRQVFFPMAGEQDGWTRLARSLRAQLDESLIDAYRGAVSIPFVPGPNGKVAVKIVDDRGIESLCILEIEG
jgi:adenine-specific DNA-methyltransferase